MIVSRYFPVFAKHVIDKIAATDHCSLCLCEMEPDSATMLPCGHVFHAVCVRQWLDATVRERRLECAICKQSFSQLVLRAEGSDFLYSLMPLTRYRGTLAYTSPWTGISVARAHGWGEAQLLSRGWTMSGIWEQGQLPFGKIAYGRFAEYVGGIAGMARHGFGRTNFANMACREVGIYRADVFVIDAEHLRDRAEYEPLPKKELLAIAAYHGLDCDASWKKPQLVDLLGRATLAALTTHAL